MKIRNNNGIITWTDPTDLRKRPTLRFWILMGVQEL